jgi:hypothetical protein
MFSPRTVGDLLPGAQFLFQDDNGKAVDISGQNLNSAFQVILKPKPGVDQPGVSRIVGTGSFTYQTNGADGLLNYSWNANDVVGGKVNNVVVTYPSQYLVYAVATIAGKPLTSDPIPLTLNPVP